MPKSPERDKLLFTPGPLTTSPTVKRAMLHDVGSRDLEFTRRVQDIRSNLLALAGARSGFEAILIQGSGTFAIEAVISSVIPKSARLLVALNGAYGRRMADISRAHGIVTVALDFDERSAVDPERVGAALSSDPAITHLAVVHCETSTGVLNPIREICAAARAHGRATIVDAMSSFGAVPIEAKAWGIDFLVSSANKCLEGVPGIAFVLARREPLEAAEGFARSVSLDLVAQWRRLERDGQFRFTPPTHVLLALHQALRELEGEGGIAARGLRYRANQQVLVSGMREIGFRPYLDDALQSYIASAFRYPSHFRFSFEEFYAHLSARGFLIYPGQAAAECFRICTIGRIYPTQVQDLLAAVRATLLEMRIPTPL